MYINLWDFFGIRATICIGQEILCLPYAEFYGKTVMSLKLLLVILTLLPSSQSWNGVKTYYGVLGEN